MSTTQVSSPIVAGAIQRVLPRHFQIIDLAVAGHDNITIAKAVGTSQSQVNLVLRSPVAQAEIARRRRESTEAEVLGLDRSAIVGKARSILDQASQAAAATLENELLAEKPEVRIKAANSILDRALGKGIDDRRASVNNITAEQVTLINLALKESEYVPAKLSAHRLAAHSAVDQHFDVHQDHRLELGPADSTCADSPGIEPGDVHEESSGGAQDE